MSERVGETYDGLWGELMFVMHDSDHLWRVNEGRANWFETLGFGDGLTILDLGCGNGFLDIVLARRGHEVVGVDQVPSVIDSAQQLVDGETVEFIVSDLRHTNFDRERFDVVFMFGLVGLMSVKDDAHLVRRTAGWLRPTGSLLVDCDKQLAETSTTRMEHPSGVIHWNWTSDPVTRTNQLTPELHRTDGGIVELRDPIDPARGDHPGLHRYIYPQAELSRRLQTAGFEVTPVIHYLKYVFPDSEPDSYMLRAQRSSR